MKEFRIVWKSQMGDQQDQVIARTESISKATTFFDTFRETAETLAGNLFRVKTFKDFLKMKDHGKTKTVKSAMVLSLIMVINGEDTEIDSDDRVYIEQEDWDE